jgi:SAM-dependent methyltransferase
MVVLSDIRLSSVRLAARLWRGSAAHVPTRALGCAFRPTRFRADPSVTDGSIETLVCDAHDPPFGAASFSVVAALNLLDTTPEPWILLGQMDALLAPGGLLVVSLPYQYDAGVPPAARLDGPDDLHALLEGRQPLLEYLSYTIVDAEAWLPWVMPANDRLVHEYRVHAVVARKNR